MELSGKVVVVTGAAGVIGAPLVQELSAQGAKVAALDLPGTDVEDIAREIESNGGEAMGQHGSQSSEADVAAMFGAVEQRWGHVDVLVNLAAARRAFDQDQDLEMMTVENWDRVMEVNLRGMMLCSKYAVPSMLARESGVIINFGSSVATLADEGQIAYSTSKAGVLAFTRALSTIYGKRGIRCNAISPGPVRGDDPKRAAAKSGQSGPADSSRMDVIARAINTPRTGVPADIAHAVVFLASDKASYITGITLPVDGGQTSHQPWVRVN